MKDRTLYVIGNSIGRQAAFGLVEMLGGATVKREKQRDVCPKHETTWGDSCHQEFASVKIKYLFLQFMDGFDYSNRHGFPFVRQKKSDGTLFTGNFYNDTKVITSPLAFPVNPYAPINMGWWADDNCIQKPTRTCLRDFFKDSTEHDVLIFTLGMSYVVKPGGGEPPLNYIDMRAWLTASAAAFRGHVGATFKGQVFRVSLAQPNTAGYMKGFEPFFYEINKVEEAVWSVGSEEKPWYTIDQWAINEGRSHMYQDHLHFNGPLTHATLHQMLNELCPGQGIPDSNGAWPNKKLQDTVVLSVDTTANPAGVTTTYYCQRNAGTLLKLSTTTGIPAKNSTSTNQTSNFIPFWLISKPVVILPEAELANVLRGEPLPSFKEGDVVRFKSGRTIYLVDKGKKNPFNDANTFIKMGFAWEQVIVLPDWVKDFVPDGHAM